jgi:hypothetical protein
MRASQWIAAVELAAAYEVTSKLVPEMTSELVPEMNSELAPR